MQQLDLPQAPRICGRVVEISQERSLGGLKLHSSVSKAVFEFGPGQACNPNDLIPAGLAGGNGNGRTRYPQKLGEEFDAGFVGPAFDGRRGQRELKCIAKFAGDRVFLGAGMDSDLKRDAFGCFSNQGHESTTESQRHGEKRCPRLDRIERRSGFLCVSVSPWWIHRLSPKIAVPTRTQVEPSSIATSKSCDMPMERTSMRIAGSLRAAMAHRSSASLRK